MKKGLGILSAIIANLASCIKVDLLDDPNIYDSILEYAVNSKTDVNNLLLGPVEISPTSWEDLDADCYVHIDNKRILIINHDPYYSVTGKTHEYKVLVLHYDSKEQLKKDFQKFIEIAGLDGSGKLSLNASGEFIQSGQENKKAIIENISVDFHEDWSGREYYFIVFDAITSEGNKESHFIMIPAEFV